MNLDWSVVWYLELGTTSLWKAKQLRLEGVLLDPFGPICEMGISHEGGSGGGSWALGWWGRCQNPKLDVTDNEDHTKIKRAWEGRRWKRGMGKEEREEGKR